MQTVTPEHAARIIALLQNRDGRSTIVTLAGNRTLEVFNIAWGQDMGDPFDHVTTNISPSVENTSIDLFFTDEVASVMASDTCEVLWSADGAPQVR